VAPGSTVGVPSGKPAQIQRLRSLLQSGHRLRDSRFAPVVARCVLRLLREMQDGTTPWSHSSGLSRSVRQSAVRNQCVGLPPSGDRVTRRASLECPLQAECPTGRSNEPGSFGMPGASLLPFGVADARQVLFETLEADVVHEVSANGHVSPREMRYGRCTDCRPHPTLFRAEVQGCVESTQACLFRETLWLFSDTRPPHRKVRLGAPLPRQVQMGAGVQRRQPANAECG